MYAIFPRIGFVADSRQSLIRIFHLFRCRISFTAFTFHCYPNHAEQDCDNLKLAAWKIKKKRERKADWNDKLKLKSKEKSETTTTHSHKTSLRIFSPFRDQKIWFVQEEGKVSIGKDLLHFLRLLAVWTHGGKNEISPLSAHSRRRDVKIASVGKIPTRIKNYIPTCSTPFFYSCARSPFAKKSEKLNMYERELAGNLFIVETVEMC